MREVRKIALICALLLITITACTPAETDPTVTPEATATTAPSNTPAPGETSLFLNKVPATIEDIKLEIFNMLTNPECLLPCLWSLNPGESINDVKTIWEKHNAESDYADEQQNIKFIKNEDIKFYHLDYIRIDGINKHYLDIYIFEGNQKINVITVNEYQLRAVNAEEWEISLADNNNFLINQSYNLEDVFQEYGEPNNVFVYVWGDYLWEEYNQPNLKPFNLILEYESFMIEYVMQRGDEGGSYMGCPANAMIQLISWDNLQKMELRDIVNFSVSSYSINKSNWLHYEELEQVADYTIQSFVDQFSVNDDCINTPSHYWEK